MKLFNFFESFKRVRSSYPERPVMNATERLCKKHEVSRDIPLHKFTTLRIGGTAEMFAQPKNQSDMIDLLTDCRALGVPYRILGRGSNLLIAGDKLEGIVIRNSDALLNLEINGRKIKVGASVPLQRMLTAAADSGLGGCEYLYSVPGNIGGTVYMNAGRGKILKRSIADHVIRVELFDGNKFRRFSRRQCRFDYRTSIFQSIPNVVILSVELRLEKLKKEAAQQALKDRVRFVKDIQDCSAPNAGSVFRENFTLADELKGRCYGMAEFSNKTQNWILNKGDHTPNDVLSLIKIVQDLHLSQNLPIPELEWRVWR